MAAFGVKEKLAKLNKFKKFAKKRMR